jgi:hypothetical protein
MYGWAYGTIFSWQPEMDLYQSSLPAVFAAILVLYTIAECPLESLLQSLLENLFVRGSLLTVYMVLGYMEYQGRPCGMPFSVGSY